MSGWERSGGLPIFRSKNRVRRNHPPGICKGRNRSSFYTARVKIPVVSDTERDNNPFLKKRITAGLFFFLAGSILLMGIITAEIFYPAGYTTAQSEISDLGATRPPDSIIYQPSASIFNATMVLGGGLLLAASILLYREQKKWVPVLFPLLLGIGVLGVGLFPGNNAIFHPLFAMLTFISGGLAAIMSWKMTSAPFRYVLVLLGMITLVFLFFASFFTSILGDGGTERFIAYPLILWMLGFGGYLIGTGERGN